MWDAVCIHRLGAVSPPQPWNKVIHWEREWLWGCSGWGGCGDKCVVTQCAEVPTCLRAAGGKGVVMSLTAAIVTVPVVPPPPSNSSREEAGGDQFGCVRSIPTWHRGLSAQEQLSCRRKNNSKQPTAPRAQPSPKASFSCMCFQTGKHQTEIEVLLVSDTCAA